MKRGLLIIMSGPSGVGKGTVRLELVKDKTLNLFYSVSMTIILLVRMNSTDRLKMATYLNGLNSLETNMALQKIKLKTKEMKALMYFLKLKSTEHHKFSIN
jgi:cytidylate kinase